MATKLTLLLIPTALAAACATPPATPSAAPPDRPAFPQFRPGRPTRLTLTAPYSGYLTRRGPCLGVTVGGRFATVIWPETARLTSDRLGLILSDTSSGASLRLGDRLEGTGGPLPTGYRHSLGDDELTEAFPIECARRPGYDGWIAIVNAGFRRGRPPAPDTRGRPSR